MGVEEEKEVVWEWIGRVWVGGWVEGDVPVGRETCPLSFRITTIRERRYPALLRASKACGERWIGGWVGGLEERTNEW